MISSSCRIGLWGPFGDHTLCTGPNFPHVPPRQQAMHSVLDVQERLLLRSGGQGVAGSNPVVPTQRARAVLDHRVPPSTPLAAETFRIVDHAILGEINFRSSP